MRNSIAAAPSTLLWIVQLLVYSSSQAVAQICKECVLPRFSSYSCEDARAVLLRLSPFRASENNARWLHDVESS
jgi:hypothetical protein